MREEDISNKALALLLGAAIIISLVGILGSKSPYMAYTLTGYATDNNATVGADLTRNVAILVTGTINFGSGYFNKSDAKDAIILNSTGFCDPLNTTFSGNSCTAQDDTDNKITIKNDGNVNVTVKMGINVSSAGSGANGLNLGAGGDLGYWLGNEKAATVGGAARPACLNETGMKNAADSAKQFPNETGYRLMGGWPVSIFGGPNRILAAQGTYTVICSKLQPEDAYDTMNVTIYMNMTRDTLAGAKHFLLNFTAIDAFPSEG